MKTTLFTVEVFDENYRVTLNEVRTMLDPHVDFIDQVLAFGLVEPIEADENDLFFDGTALQKIHTALRLQQDLHINMEGIALALELLDEIHSLRGRIDSLEKLA